jgi:hypothetical protein
MLTRLKVLPEGSRGRILAVSGFSTRRVGVTNRPERDLEKLQLIIKVRTMALGSTQPLTEMSTRNLPGVKERPARKADNLTAICEPIV